MPGGSLGFRATLRPITATVTKAEHAKIAELARRAGKPPTTYVTALLREHLAEHPTMPCARLDEINEGDAA